MEYNEENGITPQQIVKKKTSIFEQNKLVYDRPKAYIEPERNAANSIAADPVMQYMSADKLKKAVEQTKKKMEKAAKALDFIEAARLRDEMFALQGLVKEKLAEK